MPPRGVKKGTKLARQYEHIKKSEKDQGRSEARAEEIAARTVNKEKARTGKAKSSSRLSKTDMSSSRRGGLRSGHEPREGPHLRAALQRSTQDEHRRTLVDEQGPAPARSRSPEVKHD